MPKMTPDEKAYMMVMGRVIVHTRKRLELTQEEIALRSGTTQCAISRLEGGRPRESDAELLPAIATELSLTLTELTQRARECLAVMIATAHRTFDDKRKGETAIRRVFRSGGDLALKGLAVWSVARIESGRAVASAPSATEHVYTEHAESPARATPIATAVNRAPDDNPV